MEETVEKNEGSPESETKVESDVIEEVAEKETEKETEKSEEVEVVKEEKMEVEEVSAGNYEASICIPKMLPLLKRHFLLFFSNRRV